MVVSIWGMAAVLLATGLVSVLFAVQFGKQYKRIGIRKNKLLCVCFTVFACVCIITAGQIVWMYRNLLWG